MKINFFEERKKKSSYEIQRRLNVEQATHLFYSFTKKQAAQLAYELNRYEWNTDLLGEYQGIDYAMELTELFNAFTLARCWEQKRGGIHNLYASRGERSQSSKETGRRRDAALFCKENRDQSFEHGIAAIRRHGV